MSTNNHQVISTIAVSTSPVPVLCVQTTRSGVREFYTLDTFLPSPPTETKLTGLVQAAQRALQSHNLPMDLFVSTEDYVSLMAHIKTLPPGHLLLEALARSKATVKGLLPKAEKQWTATFDAAKKESNRLGELRATRLQRQADAERIAAAELRAEMKAEADRKEARETATRVQEQREQDAYRNQLDKERARAAAQHEQIAIETAKRKLRGAL